MHFYSVLETTSRDVVTFIYKHMHAYDVFTISLQHEQI